MNIHDRLYKQDETITRLKKRIEALEAALQLCITSPGAHCVADLPRDADKLFRRLVAINETAHAVLGQE